MCLPWGICTPDISAWLSWPTSTLTRLSSLFFVNPTQFGPNEDFDNYPRTLDADLAALEHSDVALVFAPDVNTMYPLGSNKTWVDVDDLGDHLCGASRAGHFRGVSTVVTKLFNAVQPDVAVFGEKDYQQLAIIRRMTAELLMPVTLIAAPTHRESDGLARSSRNGYLTAEERRIAPLLYRTLQSIANALEQGAQDLNALTAGATVTLNHAGFRVDYLTIVNANTLAPADNNDSEIVVAAAAFIGRTRLIDNIALRVERDR